MRYKLLGRSGIRVSELALGTMTFGETRGWGADRDESRRIFDAYSEAGGNFVDTANNYAGGASEELLGEFLATDRDHFVVGSKFTLTERPADPNFGGNHRKNLRRTVEGSLRRLRTDHLDLLWLHMWDGTVPVEEVMRSLDDLVRAGKVLAVGVCNTPAWVIAQANTLAAWRGWSPFVALQTPYSLANRHVERDLLPMAREFDLAVTPFGVLGGGVLSGKYGDPDGGPKRYEEAPADRLAMAEVVVQVAREAGVAPVQVALNWIRQQQGRARIVPIVGARTAEQLRQSLAALERPLDDSQLARLDEAGGFDRGYPHTYLEHPQVVELIHGTSRASLDDPRLG